MPTRPSYTAATAMPQLTSLLKQIINDHTQFGFVLGDDFVWSPDGRQIMYKKPAHLADIWTLLHEVAHAKLGHTSYDLDIELVTREVEAWEHARVSLAPLYGLHIDPDHIEDHLDTYRLWLHERSRCPNCRQNGLQTTKNTYSCNNCRCLWRVNEARICRLKRTRLPVRDHSS